MSVVPLLPVRKFRLEGRVSSRDALAVNFAHGRPEIQRHRIDCVSHDELRRVSALRGREEDQDRQLFRDVVETVFDLRGDEKNAPGGNCLVLCSSTKARTPTDYVIHLVFTMWLLLIG